MTTKSHKPKAPTKAGSPDRRKVADMVFAGMRSGMSAFKACQVAGVNQSTFNLWLNQDAELAAEYARAFSLPYPISTNRYWRNFRGRMVVSAEAVAISARRVEPTPGGGMEVSILEVV